jgi:hypothetical protein
MFEVNIVKMTDEEAAAEMARKKGASDVYPSVLAAILTNPDCDITKNFAVKLDVPADKKASTVVAGLNRARKARKLESLKIRLSRDDVPKIHIVNVIPATKAS